MASGSHIKIPLQPKVLRWARERAGLEVDHLAKKMDVKPDQIQDWEKSGQISFARINKLAKKTNTPLGFLYLPEPASDQLPISDFRTLDNDLPESVNPDLLDTILMTERRQNWMRDELIEQGHESLTFVGSYSLDDSPENVANSIREYLSLDKTWAADTKDWQEARRYLCERAESAGIFVVINGVVGNNTHRKLKPDVFRGFALVDDFAPFIFVNGTDALSAQIFTLAHELAHIWIGVSGISNVNETHPQSNIKHEEEIFCNKVAAEFLVPLDILSEKWSESVEHDNPYVVLAKNFKVSSIVIARRALDSELISKDDFFLFYNQRMEKVKETKRRSGGDFQKNQTYRVGRRFGIAVTRAVKEGRLLYRDAYALTGLKEKSFKEFAKRLGIDL